MENLDSFRLNAKVTGVARQSKCVLLGFIETSKLRVTVYILAVADSIIRGCAPGQMGIRSGFGEAEVPRIIIINQKVALAVGVQVNSWVYPRGRSRHHRQLIMFNRQQSCSIYLLVVGHISII
jgi:hypothetical protein